MIKSYIVWVDNGANGAFVEANVDSDISVRNLPSLSTLTITRLTPLTLGNTYRIKVTAINAGGQIDSPILGVVLAAIPDTPPMPTKVLAGSSHT